jgi:hypothetical protein
VLLCTGPDAVRRHQDARTLGSLATGFWLQPLRYSFHDVHW